MIAEASEARNSSSSSNSNLSTSTTYTKTHYRVGIPPEAVR